MSSIETLIHQTKFKDAHQRALIGLLYTNNLITHKHCTFLKNYEISVQQYNVLRILRGQHPRPTTIGLLRERMLDKSSDVSRIVERLRKAEMLERIENKEDRRAVDILITKKGLATLKAIDKTDEMTGREFTCLNEKEIEQLNALFDKLIDSMTPSV